MMNETKIAIMAGGSGTRLWPISRKSMPKQFIKLFEDKSLFQLSLERNKDLGDLVVIVGEEHKFIALDQITELNITADILVEPEAKNTAPCAILASLFAQEYYSKILLLPADHYISDLKNYKKTIERALNAVDESSICTIGIKPSCPHTGYGYITGTKIKNTIYENCVFKEKPDTKTALKYLSEGKYFWNSGIFACNLDFLITESQNLSPEMFSLVQQAFETNEKKGQFIHFAEGSFKNIHGNSIDYTIAEHTKALCMIEANFTWSDLGSWKSLWEVSDKDENQNYIKNSNTVLNKVSGSYISSHKLTSVIGVKDLVIVDTEDALLVAHKDLAEDVKNVVLSLSNSKYKEVCDHTLVKRPWGQFHELYSTVKYKVKHLTIKPGAQISLQYHHHRAEHWIVVSGIGEVRLNENTSEIYPNESIFIPKTATHTIKNIGKEDLHIVEVQTGTYFGEDDIVRIEDKYGRK